MNRIPESEQRIYSVIRKCFLDADEVVIPRLTKIKIDEKNPDKTFRGRRLRKIISKTQKNTIILMRTKN